jgi:NAD(P)-dependent dehydrogenase (short-subunit alcohol dehydrogenase family)
MQELAGRVAVVTGGASGIGRGTALALAGRGVHVVIGDRNEARSAEVATELAALGVEALAVTVDVSAESDLTRLRDETLERFGRVDILMNNAGIIAAGRPEQIPFEAWEQLLQVNLLSVIRSFGLFLPSMLERGDGHVVNTASTAGLYGYAWDRLPYVASKGAVIAMTEGLALYLRPRGIGVTLLCPGPVSTNIGEQVTFHGDTAGLSLRGPALSSHTPAEVGEMVADAIEQNTFFLPTNPEELAVILERRTADVDAFVDAMARDIAAGDGLA